MGRTDKTEGSDDTTRQARERHAEEGGGQDCKREACEGHGCCCKRKVTCYCGLDFLVNKDALQVTCPQCGLVMATKILNNWNSFGSPVLTD